MFFWADFTTYPITLKPRVCVVVSVSFNFLFYIFFSLFLTLKVIVLVPIFKSMIEAFSRPFIIFSNLSQYSGRSSFWLMWYEINFGMKVRNSRFYSQIDVILSWSFAIEWGNRDERDSMLSSKISWYWQISL